MSELSREEISHLAKLSRLTLSEEEQEIFAKQLPEIVGFVDKLAGLSKKSVETSGEPVMLAELRPDEPSAENLSLAQLEKLAPDWQDSQVAVPAVFGEAEDA